MPKLIAFISHIHLWKYDASYNQPHHDKYIYENMNALDVSYTA